MRCSTGSYLGLMFGCPHVSRLYPDPVPSQYNSLVYYSLVKHIYQWYPHAVMMSYNFHFHFTLFVYILDNTAVLFDLFFLSMLAYFWNCITHTVQCVFVARSCQLMHSTWVFWKKLDLHNFLCSSFISKLITVNFFAINLHTITYNDKAKTC